MSNLDRGVQTFSFILIPRQIHVVVCHFYFIAGLYSAHRIKAVKCYFSSTVRFFLSNAMKLFFLVNLHVNEQCCARWTLMTLDQILLLKKAVVRWQSLWMWSVGFWICSSIMIFVWAKTRTHHVNMETNKVVRVHGKNMNTNPRHCWRKCLRG